MKDRFMRKLLTTVAICAACAAPAEAVPQIHSILNAASYAQQGLPNSDIARGSVFVVFGSDLGPADLVQAAGFPLQTSLGGTSIRITVGTTTVDALLLYTTANQVSAVLPSTTPEGIGFLAVTYNGHTSQSGAFRVARSSPGILTQNQAGNGQALATNFNSTADQPRNTLSKPAKTGQVVTVSATGLGPISGSDAGVPVSSDLNINLQVLVGGKSATVRSKGRSSSLAGIDQIAFEVPAGVSGCYVPLVVQVDNVISNFTTISVADANSNDCTDLSGISGTTLEQLQSGGTLRVGWVVLGVTKGETVFEAGNGQFFREDLNVLSSQITLGLPSPGSCMVNPAKPATFIYSQVAPLDAGPFLNVAGPKGSRQVLQRSMGMYSESFANGTVVQFLAPGSYTLDNGSGGADVGPLHATLNFPAELTSTVQQSATGTTVNWKGGDQQGYVVVQGSAPTTAGTSTNFTCVERTSAGQFAIPSYLLSSLPATPVGVTVLTPAGMSPQNRFQARGLDYGFLSFCSPQSQLCMPGQYFYYDY
jgi:uncharacterized protein (TIGR03437 family)